MFQKSRGIYIAGGFLQRIGTSPASFTGINVASGPIGSTNWRGIATINSGVTVATVSAVHAVSGAIIHATIYQYVNYQNSINPSNVCVQSVAAGQFLVMTVGSIAPTANMPVAWSIIR